jgi:hypothetical protein
MLSRASNGSPPKPWRDRKPGQPLGMICMGRIAPGEKRAHISTAFLHHDGINPKVRHAEPLRSLSDELANRSAAASLFDCSATNGSTQAG